MRRLLPILMICAIAAEAAAAVPAFPGAEGFGAATPGGRGGRIIPVTTLADDGPGSLRAACAASGPRIVVFRVGGLITLRTKIEIVEPHLTIYGGNAPGDGICLRIDGTRDEAVMAVRTHDVVIRYLRFRPGPGAPMSTSGDALQILQDARDVIVDHCSLSWATDEIMNVWYDAARITVQNCIISEALYDSVHAEGKHPMGFLSGDHAVDVTFYRNVMIHNGQRNPRFATYNMSPSTHEIVNNLVYNHVWFGSQFDGEGTGQLRIDLRGNRYIAGPRTLTERYEVLARGNLGLYVQDNLGPHRSAGQDEWAIVGDLGNRTAPAPTSLRSSTRHVTSHSVATIPASTLVDALLPAVGCSLPVRDAVDARVLADLVAGTGDIIDHPADVGGWPTYASGSAPADGDGDGIPDGVEAAHGLDPADPADGSADRDGDGYTNVEAYLYGLDLGAPTEDTQAPTQPGGLTAAATGPTTASLSWTASTDDVGVTGYEVVRDGSVVATMTGTSFADSGLSASTTYSYRVVAMDAAGNRSPAATGNVTTPAAPVVDAPRVWWRFAEGNGTTVADSGTNGWTGTLRNGPTWLTGPVGGAVDLNNPALTEGRYVSAGSRPVGDGTAVTVALWMRNDRMGDYTAGLVSHQSRSGGTYKAGWELTLTSGKLSFSKGDPVAKTFNPGVTTPVLPALSDGQWHHVAATWSATTGTTRIHVDGVQVATGSQPSASLGAQDADFRAGMSGINAREFDGAIDEVRLYDRALDAAAIGALMAPTGSG